MANPKIPPIGKKTPTLPFHPGVRADHGVYEHAGGLLAGDGFAVYSVRDVGRGPVLDKIITPGSCLHFQVLGPFRGVSYVRTGIAHVYRLGADWSLSDQPGLTGGVFGMEEQDGVLYALTTDGPFTFDGRR